MVLFIASNDKSYFVDVDDLNPKCQNVAIFNDFVTEKDQKN